MAELAHRDALARTPGESGGVALVDCPGLRVQACAGLALACVALHPGSARRRPATAFRRAVGEVLGTPLPRRPNTVAGSEPCALWLAPERWLVVGARDGGLVAALFEALDAVDAAAVAASVSDLSDASLVLEVSGSRADALLAMACSLDVDGPALAAGRAARSLFAGQHALLYRHRDRFRVHVDATLAVFVCQWCRQAAWLLDA